MNFANCIAVSLGFNFVEIPWAAAAGRDNRSAKKPNVVLVVWALVFLLHAVKLSMRNLLQ